MRTYLLILFFLLGPSVPSLFAGPEMTAREYHELEEDLQFRRYLDAGLSFHVNEGDYVRFNFILDRLIGKPKQKIEAQISNPFMNHIGKIGPHDITDEVEKLLEDRRVIDAEFEDVTDKT